MDILDSLRQAPSAELYRLYLAIGKMLDDPRRILKVRQRLRLGAKTLLTGLLLVELGLVSYLLFPKPDEPEPNR